MTLNKLADRVEQAKWFLLSALAVVVCGAWTWHIYEIVERAHRTVPLWAGSVCQEVWRETRTGDPTVEWFSDCIAYAADRALAQQGKGE